MGGIRDSMACKTFTSKIENFARLPAPHPVILNWSCAREVLLNESQESRPRWRRGLYRCDHNSSRGCRMNDQHWAMVPSTIVARTQLAAAISAILAAGAQ